MSPVSQVSEQTHGAAQRELGRCKRVLGKHEEAIVHYRLALAVNPAMPFEWFALGFCALELTDYETAVQVPSLQDSNFPSHDISLPRFP